MFQRFHHLLLLKEERATIGVNRTLLHIAKTILVTNTVM